MNVVTMETKDEDENNLECFCADETRTLFNEIIRFDQDLNPPTDSNLCCSDTHCTAVIYAVLHTVLQYVGCESCSKPLFPERDKKTPGTLNLSDSLHHTV